MNSVTELSLSNLCKVAGKDGIADMATMDQMLLQQMMDRKGKFLEALSNIMKAETGTNTIANLK